LKLAATIGTDKQPWMIAQGDFNADGKLDLATPNLGSSDVSILLGNGDGTFQAAQPYAAGNNPGALAVGFLNRDRDPDIAVVNTASCDVEILLGSGNGAFAPPVSNAVNQSYECTSIAIADFNGDGKSDIVVGFIHGAQGDGIAVLLGNGDGSFKPAMVTMATGKTGYLAIGDVNGDGSPDAVLSFQDGTIGVLLGHGDGTFESPMQFPAGVVSTAVTLGDLNGDGLLDVVAGGVGSKTIGVLLGNGDGSFETGRSWDVAGQTISGIGIGDLNGDSKPDLVVVDYDLDEISVLLNQSPQ